MSRTPNNEYAALFRRGSKARMFIELANPDHRGFSRCVSVKEFKGDYSGLLMGNGGSWCRDDGGLAKRFNIRRIIERGCIVGIELHGLKKAPINKPIPQHIRKAFVGKRCVILGVSKVEVDHKDGRRDDPRLSDASQVKVSDFQPLSKAANNAKRQHCKECRKTNKRFDAKRLGFKRSQIRGNGTYRGSCDGCYWYNPAEFHGA